MVCWLNWSKVVLIYSSRAGNGLLATHLSMFPIRFVGRLGRIKFFLSLRRGMGWVVAYPPARISTRQLAYLELFVRILDLKFIYIWTGIWVSNPGQNPDQVSPVMTWAETWRNSDFLNLEIRISD